MADYRRMVSYMYQYKDGIKKKNVGYARIETRNGECRFTLRMQLPGLIDSIFPTYLIRRPGKEMELIYLGDSILKNQMVDTKLATSEKNISNAGYSLSEMGGMLMFLNDQEFFATEWDDKPVILSEVLQALKPKIEHQLETIETEDESKQHQVENAEAKMEYHEILGKKSMDVVGSNEMFQVEVADMVGSAEEFQEEATDMVGSAEMFQEDAVDIVGGNEIFQEEGTDIVDGNEMFRNKSTDMVDSDGVLQDKVAVAMEMTELFHEERRLEGYNLSQEETEISNSCSSVHTSHIPLYKLPRGWKTIELLKHQGGKQPVTSDKPATSPKETSKSVSSLLKAAVTVETDRAEIQQAKADQTKMDQAKTEQVKAEQAKMEQAKMEQAKTEQVKTEQVKAEQAKTEQAMIEKEKTDHIKESREDKIDYIEKTREYREDNTWEEGEALATKIFESYPRIFPFEGNEVTLCVKIEPKDIGFLPVDAWVLSNNSFLMHGYYCYNHLIFARIRDRYETKYILGVPGIYYSREQFMAKMFGFENFKSIRRRELMQGDFGYWYIPIAL